MEYLLSASQMQKFDKQTTDMFHMPSCVLMERAALCVAASIKRDTARDKKILVIAGSGNNGGDGIAVSRLLYLDGYAADTMLVESPGRHFSEENERQQDIYLKYGGCIKANPDFSEYDIIVDALFGVGLNRPLTGRWEQIVNEINRAGAYVYAIDLPSGICADTGKVLGCAVKADKTITFGYKKKGHVLFPGCLYCGDLEVADVGIYHDAAMGDEPYMYAEDFTHSDFLPERAPWGNKGTFGKLLVVAGSEHTAGAAILACQAAFRSGCGMVRLITHQANRDAVLSALPECIIDSYTKETEDEQIKALVEAGCQWADAMLVGPGIGTDGRAELLVEACLLHSSLPAVADADALNIIAKQRDKYSDVAVKRNGKLILTPHMGEFARLFSCAMEELKENKEAYVRQLAEQLHCVVVCKDARTFVAHDREAGLYCNLTGNHGMATAGSGDVLAGITAVLLMQEEHPFQAAVKAVWLHGRCGDEAAKTYGKRSVKAEDLLESLWKLIKESDEGDSEDK